VEGILKEILGKLNSIEDDISSMKTEIKIEDLKESISSQIGSVISINL
jgi:hypothetical protein